MLDRLLAAFIFFTRLPFWRLREVSADRFKTVVNYWPLVGWLTGGVTAAALYGAAQLLPLQTAVIVALALRTLMTGALHEDGLGDFFDGFGGGRTRERTLEIMKDSHTGSYGIVGLIFYYLMLYTLLTHLSAETAALLILCGDPLAKGVAAQLINLLPYARREEESKAKVIYNRMSWGALLITLLVALLPLALLLPCSLWPTAAVPVVVMLGLVWLFKRRIGGYTGDCCGATFLLCELSFYTAATICLNLWF